LAVPIFQILIFVILRQNKLQTHLSKRLS